MPAWRPDPRWLRGAVAWGYTNPEALRAHAPGEMFSSVEEILEKVE
jgi:hypothetical protein